MFPLRARSLLLGVTGSVAAFKAAALASKLTQEGAQVTALLTREAARFVSPLLFRALTGRAAYVDDDLWGPEGHILHIDLARQADALVIMPATAETLARLAQGRGEGLIPLAALAMHGKPVVVVPAMDAGMYTHPATQANVARLREWGVHVLGPVEGRLASGLVGPGRMVEPEEVLGFLRWLFSRDGPLAGQHVLVTAGPTQEPVDPVRVLTNRSSGRQGFALAQAALDAGATVTLITGPVHLPTPYGARRVDVRTAADMYDAVMDALPAADMLFKAAAVADYRPDQVATHKIKKTDAALTLRLVRTRDILAAVAQARRKTGRPRVVVGFAAESHIDPPSLRAKLRAKGVDLLAVNDITARDAGFQVPTNRIRLLYAYGGEETWPLWPKDEVARQLVMRALLVAHGFRVYGWAPRRAWARAVQAGVWHPEALDAEGAIPLARPDQLPRVLARTPRADLLVLALDARRLPMPLQWRVREGDYWPTSPAAVPLDAVVRVLTRDDVNAPA